MNCEIWCGRKVYSSTLMESSIYDIYDLVVKKKRVVFYCFILHCEEISFQPYESSITLRLYRKTVTVTVLSNELKILKNKLHLKS